MKYDAIIIGAGPGGCETALWIHRLGGRAVLVEKGEVGGVCTNRGCIPTKAMASGCEALDSVKRAGEFGIETGQPKVDPEALFKRRDRVCLTLRKGVEKLLSDAGVEVFRGEGRITSANTVEAAGKPLEGKALVIATGSTPVGLPGMEIDHEYVLSGDDAATSKTLPKAVVIVGGGFIGCEYASIYARLGCKVTLIEALNRILPSEDEEISAALQASLSKQADILVGIRVDSIDKKAKDVTAGGRRIPADLVLMAVGRRPLMPAGLEGTGVAVDRSGIKVDKAMRTNVEGVFAVGDAAAGLKLAHVAYAGAEAAARNIMGEHFEADFSAIPWCVFTSPEVARVGLAQNEAKTPVRTGRSEYIENGKARCQGEREGFCKVVADEATGALIGVHFIGAHASDLIGEASLAVRMKMTCREIAKTIHPHPTLSELLPEACRKAGF
ncbi:MAG: dihydrolipoyl dehydrogenase [Candidatus Altiarchaeota archaeon]